MSKKNNQKVKPKSNAERVRDSVKKYKEAGLIQAKVWVHPEEADAVRTYAKRKPKTNKIFKEMNNG